MASPKNKPRGYFEKLLAIDCETTGLCYNSDSPVYNPKTEERHQALSWGVIVANSMTLKPIEKLYTEIKWNEESLLQRQKNPAFGKGAEKIHGMTFQHLEENGVDEEQAVEQIGTLILKHWGPTVSIRCLGHNVHMFDLFFMRDMFRRHGIELKFGNRHYDTNSLGFTLLTTWNSDELFEYMGFPKREDHNALDDAMMALESARRLRVTFQTMVDGE